MDKRSDVADKQIHWSSHILCWYDREPFFLNLSKLLWILHLLLLRVYMSVCFCAIRGFIMFFFLAAVATVYGFIGIHIRMNKMHAKMENEWIILNELKYRGGYALRSVSIILPLHALATDMLSSPITSYWMNGCRTSHCCFVGIYLIYMTIFFFAWERLNNKPKILICQCNFRHINYRKALQYSERYHINRFARHGLVYIRWIAIRCEYIVKILIFESCYIFNRCVSTDKICDCTDNAHIV